MNHSKGKPSDSYDSSQGTILDESDFRTLNTLCFKILQRTPSIKTDRFNFGCAQKYIMYAQEGNRGQGDICEGIIARIRNDNPSRLAEVLDRFSDVEKEHIYIRDLDGYYDVFRKLALTTPIGCFFSASVDASCFLPQVGSTTASNVTIEHKICTNLFFDFCDDDEQDTLSIDDFIIVNYNNKKMLFRSLCNSLKNYGVKEDELLFRKINYDRKHNSEWICPEIASENFSRIPFELFYKDSTFSEQKEMRVAVLSDAFKCRISNPFNIKTNSFQTTKYDTTRQLIDINKQAEYIGRSAVVRKNAFIRLDICFSITRVNDC